MKFLLIIQHNNVTPRWRHPDEDEDPDRLFQSISDKVFNLSRLFKKLLVKE